MYMYIEHMCVYRYLYIYIYGCCTIPPSLLFDHPAIYKTSWRVGETTALVYKYAKTHTKTLFYCMLYYFIAFFMMFLTFDSEWVDLV